MDNKQLPALWERFYSLFCACRPTSAVCRHNIAALSHITTALKDMYVYLYTAGCEQREAA